MGLNVDGCEEIAWRWTITMGEESLPCPANRIEHDLVLWLHGETVFLWPGFWKASTHKERDNSQSADESYQSKYILRCTSSRSSAGKGRRSG